LAEAKRKIADLELRIDAKRPPDIKARITRIREFDPEGISPVEEKYSRATNDRALYGL
jgi:hypothetical protein